MNYQFASRFDNMSGSAIRNIFALLGDPEIISFAGGNPSPLTFPAGALAGIAEELIAQKSATILQYGGTGGRADLIEQVMGLLTEEGLSPKREEIITLTGSTQGIDLMTKTFVNPGDTILVEAPTFLGALQTFKAYEANIVPVEMDEQGILPEDLAIKLAKYTPKFIYLIPTFQNPTGRTLATDRRERIVSLAEEYGAMILEDDPYASLRFEGETQPSIKSYDKNGVVVKLMSFSKTISPGLRVGAAYGPAEVIAKFNIGKQGEDVHTANLNQSMVAEYIKSGAYPGRVAQNCVLYSGKMDAMYQAILKYFPQGAKVVRPEGGMFIFVELPAHLNATELFESAVQRKVAYVPGTHFYPDGGHHNTLRLNYTMAEEEQIEKGIKILGELFSA